MVKLTNLAGYYENNGLIYPANDTRAGPVHHKTLPDMDKAISYCKNKDVVVQAGGNCGVWALKMSAIFKTVYTWEPDHMNFGALAVNTSKRKNIVKFQAALGLDRNFVAMAYQSYSSLPQTLNCGATFVEGDGIIPTMRVDDLGLTKCDLIYLDIEGYEMPAFRGAVETIKKFKPVIAYEDKGLSERYGIPQGAIAAWLCPAYDYEQVATVRRDVILAPKS